VKSWLLSFSLFFLSRNIPPYVLHVYTKGYISLFRPFSLLFFYWFLKEERRRLQRVRWFAVMRTHNFPIALQNPSRLFFLFLSFKEHADRPLKYIIWFFFDI
jgi:hypothetical protein